MNNEMITIAALVTAVHKERYELSPVKGDSQKDSEFTPETKFFGKLKTSLFYTNTDAVFPTVGDYVCCQENPLGDSLILETLPRHSVFTRLNSTPGQPDQAVAANFDYVFIVQSLNGDFHTGKLERYLTVAQQSGAIPVVILSKSDLCLDVNSYVTQVAKEAPEIPVIPISTLTGDGMSQLQEYLQPEKTIVLLGSSGVGKSSLMNFLLGDSFMKTGTIRETDSQGRHTTTHRQLLFLENGARIIDTPGMRKLVVSGSEDGLEMTFDDVEELISQCRFHDCTHGNEPGCAVRRALQEGTLSQKRWENYQKLMGEERYGQSRAEYLERKQNKAKQKYSKKDRKWSD